MMMGRWERLWHGAGMEKWQTNTVFVLVTHVPRSRRRLQRTSERPTSAFPVASDLYRAWGENRSVVVILVLLPSPLPILLDWT